MPDPIADVVDLSSEEIDAFLENVDQSFGEVQGMVEPDPEELAAFFAEMTVLYPPVPFRYPDGKVVVASPWVLALGECANGSDWINRYLRFIDRNLGGAL